MTIFSVKEEKGILLHFLKDIIVSFTCNTVIVVVYENIRVIVLQVFVLEGYCIIWFCFID
jgi:hypothetical protein